MGCLWSRPAADAEASARDAEFDTRNKIDHEAEQARIKLLLLGAGESGKSTIFKQMRILYGSGFTEEQRRLMLPQMHANVLTAMKALIAACEELGHAIADEDAAASIMRARGEALLDDGIVGAVERLWADPGVQAAYSSRHRFQLSDSADYFIGKARELAAPAYAPTPHDVLKLRVRTSGIHEEEYSMDDTKITVIDVGGQRNERRKWIHCFQDVTAIVFVAAISEYDQVMYEDSSVNRLMDALRLFEDVCNSKHFENTSIILLLNKKDLFAEKIQRTPLRQPNPDAFAAEREPFLFADYAAPPAGSPAQLVYDTAIQYVVGKFLSKNRNPRKEIYWNVTCATDTDNVRSVFDSVKEIVLKENLVSSGFLGK